MDTFSIESYTHLLEELKLQSPFIDSFATIQEKGILLRHDVDYCLPTAARLAGINHAHAVKATFFILVSSPLYNIFSQEELQALRLIIDNNQNIGLHYHHTGGPLDTIRLEREFAALRLVVPETQRVVAWHNPENDLDELNRQAESNDFIPAYSPAFFGDGKYISDSNCRHTPDEILDFQRKASGTTQILLHPLIWIRGGSCMKTVLRRTFVARLDSVALTFAENQTWRDCFGRSILSQFNLGE